MESKNNMKKEMLIRSLKQVVITGKTYTEYIAAIADHILTNYDLTRKGREGGKVEYRSVTPAADVVEVVRCKNCKHASRSVYCYYACKVDQRIAHDENDYCSYGERREK